MRQTTPASPWVERFLPALSEQEIRDKVRVIPTPFHALVDESLDAAAARLEATLKQIFLPTTQVVAAIQKFIGMAIAYSRLAYPDVPTYVINLYSRTRTKLQQFPCCLTGLAGVGKSAILDALRKVMPRTFELEVPGHGPIKTRSLWSFEVVPQVGGTGVMTLIPDSSAGTQEESDKALLKPQTAYRDGIALQTGDEVQAIALGDNANARATKALLQVAQVGPPFVYAVNYSLVHKLMRRNQEDRQRLLSDPLVIEPDGADTEDWLEYLRVVKATAPEIFTFDAEKDRHLIHRLTAGIKRCVVILLVSAYRDQRRRGGLTVDADAIKAAYLGRAYATCRNDVEGLIEQAISGKPKHKTSDLWCPFPAPVPPSNVIPATAAIEHHQQRIQEQHLLDSLPLGERKQVERELKAVADPQSPKAKVVGFPKKRPSKEDLLAGLRAFSEGAPLTPDK